MEQKTKAPLHAFKDEQSGKWGFKNVNDEIVVSPRWWLIYHKFDEGMCAVADDDKKIGFVDETGKLVILCRYVSHSYFCEGLVKVQEAETYKIGYINKEGKTVIPFVYRKGGDYENGLAMVSSDNGLWGAINQKNMVVYPFKYGWEELYDILHKCGNEKAVERKENKMTTINLHVYDEDLTLTIDESKEKIYQKAAEIITKKLTEYTEQWSNRKSPHTISLITMLDLAYGMMLYQEGCNM